MLEFRENKLVNSLVIRTSEPTASKFITPTALPSGSEKRVATAFVYPEAAA
jgi:hypothetical protein